MGVRTDREIGFKKTHAIPRNRVRTRNPCLIALVQNLGSFGLPPESM
jgi:hypothetical protein